jgi:transposase
MLSDELWNKVLKILKNLSVYITDNTRMVIEGILWRIRTAAPWRDLPSDFCPWTTAYNRFNAWSRKGIWNLLFEAVKNDVDLEWAFIDGSYVKAHQHASGGIEPETSKTIGKSKGGNTTKIHMVVDSHGNPIKFDITAGNIHDVSVAADLLDGIEADNVIADKGYDSDALRDGIREMDATPHIPRRRNSKKPNSDFDRELYRSRHLVENAFAKLKHFRAIATRFDKLSRNYRSVVEIGCIFWWIKLCTRNEYRP